MKKDFKDNIIGNLEKSIDSQSEYILLHGGIDSVY